MHGLKAAVEMAGALLLPRPTSGGTGETTPSPHTKASSHFASARPLDAALRELELRLIRDAMTAEGSNQSEAAPRLGISRVGLTNKLI